MRSIKFFFLVLAGLVVFSLMLRILLPVVLFVGAIGLGLFLMKKIGRALHREYAGHQGYSHPYLRQHEFRSEPLFQERQSFYDDLDDVQYIEVR